MILVFQSIVQHMLYGGPQKKYTQFFFFCNKVKLKVPRRVRQTKLNQQKKTNE